MLGRRPSSDSNDPSPDESTGSVARILQSIQTYFAARTELFGIESAEAAQYAKQQAVLGIILVIAAFFGYALLLVALVSLLGSALSAILPSSLAPFGWQIMALLFAALHLLLAFCLGKKLRQPPTTPLFETTRAEFQKDRQWINDQQSTTESDS